MRTKEPCVAVFGLAWSGKGTEKIVSASYDSMGECRQAIKVWKDGVKGLQWITIVPKNGVPEQVKC